MGAKHPVALRVVAIHAHTNPKRERGNYSSSIDFHHGWFSRLASASGMYGCHPRLGEAQGNYLATLNR